MQTQPKGIELLDSKNVALVAIDLQSKLLPAIFEAERVIKNTVILLRLGQMLSIPVILTTQYAQGLGPVVPDVAAPPPAPPRWTKPVSAALAMRASCGTLKKSRRIAPRCWWRESSRTSA